MDADEKIAMTTTDQPTPVPPTPSHPRFSLTLPGQRPGWMIARTGFSTRTVIALYAALYLAVDIVESYILMPRAVHYVIGVIILILLLRKLVQPNIPALAGLYCVALVMSILSAVAIVPLTDASLGYRVRVLAPQPLA